MILSIMGMRFRIGKELWNNGTTDDHDERDGKMKTCILGYLPETSLNRNLKHVREVDGLFSPFS